MLDLWFRRATVLPLDRFLGRVGRPTTFWSLKVEVIVAVFAQCAYNS